MQRLGRVSFSEHELPDRFQIEKRFAEGQIDPMPALREKAEYR